MWRKPLAGGLQARAECALHTHAGECSGQTEGARRSCAGSAEERMPAAESRLVEPLDMSAQAQPQGETLAPEILVNALQDVAQVMQQPANTLNVPPKVKPQPSPRALIFKRPQPNPEPVEVVLPPAAELPAARWCQLPCKQPCRCVLSCLFLHLPVRTGSAVVV